MKSHSKYCFGAPYATNALLLDYFAVREDENGCVIPTRNVRGRLGTNTYLKLYGAAYRLIGESYIHRAVWVVSRGEVPNGMEVSHICRHDEWYGNPQCVNIEHMLVESHRENLMRVSPKIRRERGTATCGILKEQKWQCLGVMPSGAQCPKIIPPGPLGIHQKATGHTGRERIA